MKTVMRLLVGVAVGLFAAGWCETSADPAPAVKPTTVTVPDMDCAGCAKKLTAKLKEVPGVVKAEADLEKRTINGDPRAGFAVSPKEVREAVEKGAKSPRSSRALMVSSPRSPSRNTMRRPGPGSPRCGPGRASGCSGWPNRAESVIGFRPGYR